MVVVEMRALGVQEQRVLLRRRREVALRETDHAHGPEAHVAQGVDVHHVDAARAEGARATRSRIVRGEALDHRAHGPVEAVGRDLRGQAIQPRQGGERAGDGLVAVEVGLEQVGEVREMLAPGSLGRTLRDALGELLDESAEPVDLGQPFVEPFGAVAVLVGPLCLGVAVGLEAIAPLVPAANDACLPREAVPCGGAPGKPFARRLWESRRRPRRRSPTARSRSPLSRSSSASARRPSGSSESGVPSSMYAGSFASRRAPASSGR